MDLTLTFHSTTWVIVIHFFFFLSFLSSLFSKSHRPARTSRQIFDRGSGFPFHNAIIWRRKMQIIFHQVLQSGKTAKPLTNSFIYWIWETIVTIILKCFRGRWVNVVNFVQNDNQFCPSSTPPIDEFKKSYIIRRYTNFNDVYVLRGFDNILPFFFFFCAFGGCNFFLHSHS